MLLYAFVYVGWEGVWVGGEESKLVEAKIRCRKDNKKN